MITKFKIFEYNELDPYGEENWNEDMGVVAGDLYKLVNIPRWWRNKMEIGDVVKVRWTYSTLNGEKRIQFKPFTPIREYISLDMSMKTFKDSFERVLNESIRWYNKGKLEPEEPEKDGDECKHDWVHKSGFGYNKFRKKKEWKEWEECTKCELRNYNGKFWRKPERKK